MSNRCKIYATFAPLALMLGIFVPSVAYADGTPECNNGVLVNSTECGTNSSATAFATAVGQGSEAIGEGGTAVGFSSAAKGYVSTALGTYAEATGRNSVAVGAISTASGENAIAIGEHSNAPSLNTTAIGYFSGASGEGSTALGALSAAGGGASFSTALGAAARASASNTVALGAGSVADQANTVSVGTVGGERRVVNVAAGTAATDAVNVSQLTATNTMIAIETTNRANADAVLSSRLDGLSFDIRDTAREARAGTASALAAAGLPQASGEGRTMIAGGVGTYRGKTAFAAGASHRLQGGQGTFKVGVTYDSEKHVGANGGFGFEF